MSGYFESGRSSASVEAAGQFQPRAGITGGGGAETNKSRADSGRSGGIEGSRRRRGALREMPRFEACAVEATAALSPSFPQRPRSSLEGMTRKGSNRGARGFPSHSHGAACGQLPRDARVGGPPVRVEPTHSARADDFRRRNPTDSDKFRNLRRSVRRRCAPPIAATAAPDAGTPFRSARCTWTRRRGPRSTRTRTGRSKTRRSCSADR